MLSRLKHLIKNKAKLFTKRKILFRPNIPEITPIFIEKANIPFQRRLNLLIPSLNKEHMFGGIATALSFFKSIMEELKQDQNTAFRIIITDSGVPDRNITRKFLRFKITNKEEGSRFQILPFGDRLDKKLPVIEKDYFIATAWWTAYLAKRIIKQQEYLFKKKHKFIYLIQDYEPGFYNWSSRYILAESTYQNSENTIAVFNSSLLMNFFRKKGLCFWKHYYFEPRLNNNLRQFLTLKGKQQKEKVILIYGRPYTPRNGFELVKLVLEAWACKDSRARYWKFISVGEKHPPLRLGAQKMISLGKLPLEEYARWLLRSAVGISLMISPHPSYPPLEMANFGLLTITNKFANKDLSCWHTNIYSLDSLEPEALTQALKKLVSLFEKNPQKSIKGQDLTGFYLSEDPIFPFLQELIHELFEETC